jgi:hypothetical protein
MSRVVAGALILVTLMTVAAAGAGAGRSVGDLRLVMDVGKVVYQSGEPVTVHLRVTNTGAGPLPLSASSGQQYDLIVRQRGALIWQWSHDKAFVQVVREITMAPGQTLTFSGTWDQRDLQGRQVEAGAYEVSAVFFGAQRGGPRSIEVGPIRIKIGR